MCLQKKFFGCPSTSVSSTHTLGKALFLTGHVMMSYQHSDKETVRKIKQSLTECGHKVWIDEDNMAGSTLAAMAKAVEDASVVFVCMSERYKFSENCRSEAEYAFKLKKRIVPLMMQRNYEPDGWLGIILASKLFYDFSGKYPYITKLEALVKELGEGKEDQSANENDGELLPAQANQRKPRDETHSISSWSEKDISNWLTKLGLQTKPSLKNLTGKHLQFLKRLSRTAAEFYYNYLQTKLDLDSLNDMTTFCEAIEML